MTKKIGNIIATKKVTLLGLSPNAYIYMLDMEATELHYLLSPCLQSGGAWEEYRESRSTVELSPVVRLL